MKINGRTVHSEKEILSELQKEFNQTIEFAVLDNGDNYFIQTSGGALEYHAGEKHYYIAQIPVPQDKIEAAFISYYRNDGKYLNDFEWQEENHETLWSKIKKLFSK